MHDARGRRARSGSRRRWPMQVDVALHMDADTFVRLVGGRGELDELAAAVRVEGDREPRPPCARAHEGADVGARSYALTS